MPLRFDTVTVSDIDGQQQPALLARCNCMTLDPLFVVFQVEGQDHLHIQCAECGTSYCPGGRHDQPPEGAS